MAFATATSNNSVQTQWRGEDYMQQWQNYFVDGHGTENLLDALEIQQSMEQAPTFFASVDIAQTPG